MTETVATVAASRPPEQLPTARRTLIPEFRSTDQNFDQEIEKRPLYQKSSKQNCFKNQGKEIKIGMNTSWSSESNSN